MTKISIYLTILLLSITGCFGGIDWNEIDWNEEHRGPNGEHFHAVVDGKDWYPQISFVSPGQIRLTYPHWRFGNDDYCLSLGIRRDYNPESYMYIAIDSVAGPGIYTLGDTSSSAWAYYEIQDTLPTRGRYYTTDVHTGTFEITSMDSTNGLIGGTVSFDAIQSSATIKVREGTFLANISY